MALFLFFLINTALSFAVGSMGSDRKIGFALPFIISFFLSFLIGIIFVLASDKKTESSPMPFVSLTSEQSSRLAALRKEAMAQFKDYDYAASLQTLLSAESINPYDYYTLIDIACIYSIQKNQEKSFEYIERAAASGHPALRTVLARTDFEFIRQQPEFSRFVGNGYKTEKATPMIMMPGTQLSAADELAKLADLRDKNILTEDEFQAQKAKLLNG